MLTLQRPGQHDNAQDDQDEHDQVIRDIHPLTPPPNPSPATRGGARWETSSHRSSASTSTSSELAPPSENFTTISREFNALVIAGSSMENNDGVDSGNPLSRIGEDDVFIEETNPLAIVPDTSNYIDPSPVEPRRMEPGSGSRSGSGAEVSLQRVKKEEVESKISAWQNAKIAKINNRFKREDAVLNGWESEQVQKATSWMKKIERKLEEKRAKGLEKMQNDVAKARRKAEEKRASAEAKRGTKVAQVLEIANLMRVVGRPPAKRSFF